VPVLLAPLLAPLLALAALPWLIHWLTRRRAQARSFPALAFLARSEAGRARRHRLREFAVLALRTLALLAAALAAAGLAWRGPLAGEGAAVIVLDASCSMRQEVAGGTAFARGQALAGALAERLRPRPVAVVVAGDPARVSGAPGSAGPALALLAESAPGWGDGGPAAAVAAAAGLLPGGGEILLVSDLARGCLGGLDATALPAGTGLTLIDAGGGGANLGVTALTCDPANPVAGRPLRVQAHLLNGGAQERSVRLRLRAGSAASVQEIAIAAGGSAIASLDLTPEAAGQLELEAEIAGAGDALADDDRRCGVLTVAEALDAVVAGDGDRLDAQGPAHPLAAALAAAGLRVRRCDGPSLAAELAAGRPALLATAGLRDGTAAAAAVAAHLAAGGAWWQVVACDGDAALAAAIPGQPAPAPLGAAVDVSEQEAGATTLAQARLDHPLLTAFPGREALLAAVRVCRYRLTPSGAAADAVPLLAYADGTVAWAERRAGAGRWLLWNGSPAAIDGTWARCEALPLIAHRLPAWLAPAGAADCAWPAGTMAAGRWLGAGADATAALGDGRTRLLRPGLVRDGAHLAACAVPALESDLRRIDPQRAGVRALSADQALGGAAPVPAWPWLLLLVALALAGELLLAGAARRSRP
jgi:hypothetical protein